MFIHKRHGRHGVTGLLGNPLFSQNQTSGAFHIFHYAYSLLNSCTTYTWAEIRAKYHAPSFERFQCLQINQWLSTIFNNKDLTSQPSLFEHIYYHTSRFLSQIDVHPLLTTKKLWCTKDRDICLLFCSININTNEFAFKTIEAGTWFCPNKLTTTHLFLAHAFVAVPPREMFSTYNGPVPCLQGSGPRFSSSCSL